MKIAVVSIFPPTSQNVGGPSALCYYLLKYAPKGAEVTLYYYGKKDAIADNIPGVKIIKIPLKGKNELKKNLVIKLFKNFKFLFQIIFLKYFPIQILPYLAEEKIVKEINKSEIDLLWLYQGWLVNWAPKIKSRIKIISGMDSFSLKSERILKRYSEVKNFLKKENRKYLQSIHLEKLLAIEATAVHMVGIEDRDNFNRKTNLNKAFFTPHPHFYFSPLKRTLRELNGSRVNLLLSGEDGAIYYGDEFARIVEALVLSNSLQGSFTIDFLGKGLKKYAELLMSKGFVSNSFEWVENYEEFISKYQVQIFPIIMGTGTKGKVLNALVTGQLCIGTKYAFENIDLDINKDVILYEKASEIPQTLQKIIDDQEFYCKLSASTSNKIKKAHSPEYAASLFWEKAVKAC